MDEKPKLINPEAGDIFLFDQTYKHILDNLNIALLLLDTGFTVKFKNKKADYYVCKTHNRLITVGESVLNFLEDEDVDIITHQLNSVLMGQHLYLARKVKSFENKDFWFEYTLYPLQNDENAISGIMMNIRDITGMKSSEYEILKSNERYKDILDSQSELICIMDSDGTITFVNKYYCKFFGKGANNFIGLNFFDLVPPSLKGKAKDDLLALTPDNPSIDQIIPVINFNGETRWISTTTTAFFDDESNITGLQNIAKDITELKKIEDQLLYANSKLNAILNSSPDLIVIFDRQGTILDFYTNSKSLIKNSAENIRNRNYKEFVDESHHADILKLIDDTFCSKEIRRFEFPVNYENEIRYFESHSSCYNENEAVSIVRDITEIRKEADSIVESEELYRKIVQAAPYGILISDIDGKIIFHSQQICALLGFPDKTEILGLNMKDFIYDHDKKRFEKYLADIVNDISTGEDHFTFVNNEDEKVIIEIHPATITTRIKEKHSIIMVMRNITDKIEIEKQWKLLYNAVEQTPVSILITDKTGVVEYVNEAFAKITGYQPYEVVGKIHDFIDYRSVSEKTYAEFWRTIKSGNEWIGELQNRRKDGTVYWESITISPVVALEDEITQFIEIKKDISEQKHVQEELKEAKRRAEESDRLKSSFLRNISHEIRTPLNGILGFTSLIRISSSDERNTKFLDMITKSCNWLLSIVNNLLEISIIESKNPDIAPTNTSLRDLINNMYDYTKNYLHEQNKSFIKLVAVIPEPGIEEIFIDGTRVSQIFMNLLNNAVKFTPNGFIEFGYELSKPQTIRFFVKDSGIGIEESVMPIIFKPFRQGDETLSRKYGGNGLGLAISEILVNKMGGNIRAESKPGEGTVFYFEFPLKIKETDKKHRVIPVLPTGEKEYKWPGKKILIIEDSYINYILLRELLKKTDVTLLLAQTGLSGIEHVKANPDIDLVFLDIMLPDIEGYEVAQVIKKRHPELPIVAVTAYAHDTSREDALNAGCVEYITKPFSKDHLMEVIEKILVS